MANSPALSPLGMQQSYSCFKENAKETNENQVMNIFQFFLSTDKLYGENTYVGEKKKTRCKEFMLCVQCLIVSKK